MKLQRALSANNAEDATKAPHLSAAASSMQLSPAVSRCRCRALRPYWQLVQDAHLHRVYSGRGASGRGRNTRVQGVQNMSAPIPSRDLPHLKCRPPRESVLHTRMNRPPVPSARPRRLTAAARPPVRVVCAPAPPSPSPCTVARPHLSATRPGRPICHLARPFVRIRAYSWRVTAHPGRNIGVRGVRGGRNKGVQGPWSVRETLFLQKGPSGKGKPTGV